jgi:hypothetical protein
MTMIKTNSHKQFNTPLHFNYPPSEGAGGG